MMDVRTLSDLRLLANVLDDEGKPERARSVRAFAARELERLEEHLAESWRELEAISEPGLVEEREAVQREIEDALRQLSGLFPDLAPGGDP
jgi:hypothetical protein